MVFSDFKSIINIVLLVGVGYFSYKCGLATVQDNERTDSSGKITLHYFDGRWTTETIRLLLKYGGLDFNDKRIGEDWKELKPNTPFGHLPVIEQDGKMAPQSIAIARYIAKKVKLTGANDWEDLLIDGIVDTLNDVKEKLTKVLGEEGEKAKETLKEKHLKETIPYYFEKLDKMAKENKGHLVGKKLTWADFYFVVAYDVYTGILGDNLLEKYPNLANVRKNVLEVPAVKTWVETRPKTDF